MVILTDLKQDMCTVIEKINVWGGNFSEEGAGYDKMSAAREVLHSNRNKNRCMEQVFARENMI